MTSFTRTQFMNRMTWYTKKNLYMLGALFITITLYFIFSISGVLYAFTDNTTVGVVTSGMYGANNMCQYLHPLACLIIKVLNPLLPTADVFASLTHLALLSGIYLISYAAIETSFRRPLWTWKAGDIVFAATFLLSISYFALGLKLFGVNYTVQTSAIFAEGVIVLFYACHTGKGRKWIFAGTAIVFAGMLGRLEASLLFLPFLALELLTEFVRSKHRLSRAKHDLRYIVPSFLVVVILLGTKWVFLQIEPYKTDAAYNRYRTIAEDYPMETYGVTYKDFSEIDHDMYLMVTHWGLTDTDLINTESMKKIAEVGSRNDYQWTREGLRRTIQEMMRRATQTDVHVMTLLALTITLTIWILFAAKGLWLKLEALFCFLGGFIILFYFTFRGRAPLRVWQCTLIAGLTTLIFVTVKDRIEKQPGKEDGSLERKKAVPAFAVFCSFLCFILYFGIGQVLAHSTIHTPITPLTARTGADDNGYMKTFEKDSLYIWPGWYLNIPDYFAKQNKLPTQRVIDHNIAMGDWVYGQVYFRDFLNRIGASNPALALLDRPNTFMMEGEEDLVLSYMRGHYGENINLVYSHYVNGKKAYKLVRRETNSQLQSGVGDE